MAERKRSIDLGVFNIEKETPRPDYPESPTDIDYGKSLWAGQTSAHDGRRTPSPRPSTGSESKNRLRSNSTHSLLDLPQPAASRRTSITTLGSNEMNSHKNTDNAADHDRARRSHLSKRRQSTPEIGLNMRGLFGTSNGIDPTRPQGFSEVPRSRPSTRKFSVPEMRLQVPEDPLTSLTASRERSPGKLKPSSRRSSKSPSLDQASDTAPSPGPSISKTEGRKRRTSNITDPAESGISSGADGDSQESVEPEVNLSRSAKQQANSEENNEKNGESADNLKWRPFDTFGEFEWVFDDDRTFREILKVIRCSLYGFIILVLLVGTVVSRISLFLLASDINQSKEARGESIVHLILCVCAPMLYNWIQAFMKILFGGKEWPNFKMLLMNVTIELMATFGLCLLLFRVIPSTDFFTGIIVTFSMFQVPSILKFFTHSLSCESTWRTPLRMAYTFVAMTVQLACPVYFLVYKFSSYVITVDKDHSQETSVTARPLQNLKWELPLALCLMSLSWWENYFFDPNDSKQTLKHFRRNLQETRDTCCVLITPLKVGLLLVLARYLPHQEFSLYEWEESSSKTVSEFYGLHFSLLCIILGSSILCTYLGGLACKLHMQKIAFALPLILSPPVSLVVVYLQCRYEFLPDTWHIGSWYCPSLSWADLKEPIAVGAVLWLSYCFIVSQIWFPGAERMAKIERLFLTPHFNSIFPDFNLTLHRRRDRIKKSKAEPTVGRKSHDDVEQGTKERNKEKINNSENEDVPRIFICATMWHETKREMTQLLKSLFRLDYEHCARKLARTKYNIRAPDFYEMEIHIHFDDAFALEEDPEKRDSKKAETKEGEDEKPKHWVPNKWVRQFIGCMEDAARSVIKGFIIIPDPIKVVTPYGGRLEWTMPGQNKLVVHLKDKNKIRHRKRWSQVMYMYYLLGYKMLGHGDGSGITEEDRSKHHSSQPLRRRRRNDGERPKNKTMPFRQMLMRIGRDEYEELVDKCENTFILTLDGDIDFKPDSVNLLIDRMKKDRKVAAVCGRIHPIGSGPMVWYQEFEYAVSHWLQKAAEHVFGCVLCCPGCFSLFRASALMDDNVLKTYTTKPSEPLHFIQFEQGEDRWLCTLLLQQGYRIDYSACADALTYAPESFAEFFNQRRRWSPSTLANIMDLLGSWRTTTRLNDNISRLYMLYQLIVMMSTLVAPSFLILMMTYSFQTVLTLNTWWSYVLSVVPVVFYIFICLTKKNETQVKVGAVLSALYAVVMMIITVSTIISVVEENFNSPNVIFIALLTFIFITASFLHPQEFFCLLPGVLYFLTIPANFLLLTVFYLCNLNNVSWGTREVETKTPEELKRIEDEKAAKKNKTWNIFSARGLKTIVDEIRDLVKTIWGLKKDLEEQQMKPSEKTTEEKTAEQPNSKKDSTKVAGIEDDPEKPYWLRLSSTGLGQVDPLDKEETEFWKFIIKKYLHPLEVSEEEKQKLSDGLRELRNNVVFICVMVNLLWTVIALQLRASEERLKSIYIAGRYEPIAVLFLAVFAIVLFLQFVGMVIHSWGTFLHFMSTTHIDWFSSEHSDEEFARYVVQEVAKTQSLEPRQDYDDDEESSDSLQETAESPLDEDTNSVFSVDAHSTRPDRRHQRLQPELYPGHAIRRPSMPGQFPRLSKIFEHHQRKHHFKRPDPLNRVRRRDSWESENSGTSWGQWEHPVSARGNNPRRHDRQKHFWNDRNSTMRLRFQRLQEMHGIEEENDFHTVRVI